MGNASFPIVAEQIVNQQESNGSWRYSRGWDKSLGEVYTTTLAILTLTPPYQLLPIYQR